MGDIIIKADGTVVISDEIKSKYPGITVFVDEAANKVIVSGVWDKEILSLVSSTTFYAESYRYEGYAIVFDESGEGVLSQVESLCVKYMDKYGNLSLFAPIRESSFLVLVDPSGEAIYIDAADVLGSYIHGDISLDEAVSEIVDIVAPYVESSESTLIETVRARLTSVSVDEIEAYLTYDTGLQSVVDAVANGTSEGTFNVSVCARSYYLEVVVENGMITQFILFVNDTDVAVADVSSLLDLIPNKDDGQEIELSAYAYVLFGGEIRNKNIKRIYLNPGSFAEREYDSDVSIVVSKSDAWSPDALETLFGVACDYYDPVRTYWYIGDTYWGRIEPNGYDASKLSDNPDRRLALNEESHPRLDDMLLQIRDIRSVRIGDQDVFYPVSPEVRVVSVWGAHYLNPGFTELEAYINGDVAVPTFNFRDFALLKDIVYTDGMSYAYKDNTMISTGPYAFTIKTDKVLMYPSEITDSFVDKNHLDVIIKCIGSGIPIYTRRRFDDWSGGDAIYTNDNTWHMSYCNDAIYKALTSKGNAKFVHMDNSYLMYRYGSKGIENIDMLPGAMDAFRWSTALNTTFGLDDGSRVNIAIGDSLLTSVTPFTSVSTSGYGWAAPNQPASAIGHIFDGLILNGVPLTDMDRVKKEIASAVLSGSGVQVEAIDYDFRPADIALIESVFSTIYNALDGYIQWTDTPVSQRDVPSQRAFEIANAIIDDFGVDTKNKFFKFVRGEYTYEDDAIRLDFSPGLVQRTPPQHIDELLNASVGDALGHLEYGYGTPYVHRLDISNEEILVLVDKNPPSDNYVPDRPYCYKFDRVRMRTYVNAYDPQVDNATEIYDACMNGCIDCWSDDDAFDPQSYINPDGAYVEYTIVKNGDSLEIDYIAKDAAGNDITDSFYTISVGEFFMHREVE